MTPGTEFPKAVARAALKRVGRVAARLQEERALPADVLESDGEYLVVVDVPGATPSDVRVRYVEGDVRISVDRFRNFNEGFEMRFPGRGLQLDGAVSLPDDAVVDPDAASARLQSNGTLQVYLPKEETDTASGESEAVGSEDASDDTADADADADDNADDSA